MGDFITVSIEMSTIGREITVEGYPQKLQTIWANPADPNAHRIKFQKANPFEIFTQLQRKGYKLTTSNGGTLGVRPDMKMEVHYFAMYVFENTAS